MGSMGTQPEKIDVKKRRRARFHVIQAVYQREMAGHSFSELKKQYYRDNINRHPVEWSFFDALLDGLAEHQIEIDIILTEYVDRSFERIHPIEKSVLRLGCYELMYYLEIPYQVIVNEYVDHAKSMGTEQGHKFVNGMLDGIAKKLRNVRNVK